jgi:hypothetical protein
VHILSLACLTKNYDYVLLSFWKYSVAGRKCLDINTAAKMTEFIEDKSLQTLSATAIGASRPQSSDTRLCLNFLLLSPSVKLYSLFSRAFGSDFLETRKLGRADSFDRPGNAVMHADFRVEVQLCPHELIGRELRILVSSR